MTSHPRVGLNFRLAHHGWLGGFYYLQNLALALRSLPEDDRPELAAFVPVDDARVPAHELEAFDDVVGFNDGDPRRQLRVRVQNRLRRLLARRSWGLESALAGHRVDVLFPAVDEGAGLARPLPWIFDLQHFAYPEYFSERELAKRTALFGRIAEESPLIVVSSRVAADELQRRFPSASAKLRLLRFTTVPGDDWLEGDPAATVARYRLPERFLLLPNQFWAHKDHRTAFEAVRLLRERGERICLVCTGATEDSRHPDHFGELELFLDEHGLTEQVRILGAVPRADYVQLLRAAEAVVQPSRFEGWSSVVEDARALGKRLVVSDLEVHREQDPEGGLFFPTSDAAALAERLLQALEEASPAREEREALAAQQQRVRAYGLTFAAIARERAELP